VKIPRLRLPGTGESPRPLGVRSFSEEAGEEASGGSELPHHTCAFRAESMPLPGGCSSSRIYHSGEE
jgi:hypothetical protein